MSISAQPEQAAAEGEGVALELSSQRGTLLSRLRTLRSLRRAFDRVARNPRASGGVDDVSVAAFDKEKEQRLRMISRLLRDGAYTFSPLRPVAVLKKNRIDYRPILVPTVSDRVVQRAILHQIAPFVAPHISHRTSHAFRAHLGVKSAVGQLVAELQSGKRVVLVVDIENFFGSIDAARLFNELLAVLPDDSLVPLINQLQNWELNDLSTLPIYKRGCFPEQGKGVPQGSALSPVLSNFFLRHLDAEAANGGITAIRYADDIAIACGSRSEAERAYTWLAGHMKMCGLRIHPLEHKKSKITEIGVGGMLGVEYLGFFLSPHDSDVTISISNGSFARAKSTIDDCFDPRQPATLAERYTRLTYFLNSWLGTYGHVCATDAERAQLLDCAHRCLSRLLVQRGLLPNDRGLTREQRAFLGIDSIFANAEHRRAVGRAISLGKRRQIGS